MFLRAIRRKKDGKEHRYFSVVENRRVRSGVVVQRQVLYLGEINDSQQAAWTKSLEVFDEAEQRYATLSLFPDDRGVPAEAIDSIQVKLSEMELRRPRAFGNCWLACHLWQQLGLDQFWQEQLFTALGHTCKNSSRLEIEVDPRLGIFRWSGPSIWRGRSKGVSVCYPPAVLALRRECAAKFGSHFSFDLREL